MKPRANRLLAVIGAVTMLGGLLAGTHLSHAGAAADPNSFKEAGTAWKVAAPADRVPRGEWWALYDDSALNRLESKLDADNPSLAAALARYDTARGRSKVNSARACFRTWASWPIRCASVSRTIVLCAAPICRMSTTAIPLAWKPITISTFGAAYITKSAQGHALSQARRPILRQRS